MAIKRVVNKSKIKVNKKFPEFDVNKIYVKTGEVPSDCCKITKQDNGRFRFDYYGSSGAGLAFDTFEELLKYSPNVYILNNKEELARFLLGCREFPKVEENEDVIIKELADNEVSVESCDIKKYIYGGIMREYNEIFLVQDYTYTKNTTQVVKFKKNTFSANSVYKDDYNYIKYYAKDYELYQFDTQEEFLRWSLEQVTGKKFEKRASAQLFSSSDPDMIGYATEDSYEVFR